MGRASGMGWTNAFSLNFFLPLQWRSCPVALVSYTFPDGRHLLQASNILVGRDGKVRLADLGVAAKLERHFSGDQEAYASLERRNTFVGSPAYIAPELLTGNDQG